MKQKGRTLVSLSFALVSVDNDLITKNATAINIKPTHIGKNQVPKAMAFPVAIFKVAVVMSKNIIQMANFR